MTPAVSIRYHDRFADGHDLWVRYMKSRKHQLLKRHRRNKRLLLAIAMLMIVLLGALLAWWLVPLLLPLLWLAHEAWFSDHLFYSREEDYLHAFSAGTARQKATIANDRLQLSEPLAAGETLILEIRLRATWLGRWRDPHVLVGDDRQDFELGARGRRYLNLSGQATAIADGGLTIRGRHCRLSHEATLHVFDNPDFRQRRLMILAPHADDAELAAFGVYSEASEAVIVTLTQGEVEAGGYRRFGLDAAAAARLKGRLRAWDSRAIPLWGGVPQSRCFQLGYFCMQLASMLAKPGQTFPSRASADSDIRPVRVHNPFSLPGDVDGLPNGANLLGDLVALLEHFRPEVVIVPHPELDPHPDHVATAEALQSAARQSSWKPEIALLYANHLHDNDRWPLGPAGHGVALPPALAYVASDGLWSPWLSAEKQLDKAMALAMQHDLQGRQSVKRRLRRLVQRALVGRRWPVTGDNPFFRKAIRRHEIFWVRRFQH